MEPNGFEIVPYYMETNNRKENQMNNDRHTVCPKCEFEWQELLVDDGEEYIPNHYCSAKAPLDNGEDSWVEDGEVK
tara:strand:+ start:75 stop:302 length:228 start_codon:yes stop_codon:yes gene_type:complete